MHEEMRKLGVLFMSTTQQQIAVMASNCQQLYAEELNLGITHMNIDCFEI